MLNLSFAGTLGADAETRAAGQNTVTEFRVAVNGYDRKAKAKTTTWLKVNVWGQRGEQLAGMVAKGSKVAGSGQFEVQTYTNRDGETKTSFVVSAQDLTLMSFKADSDGAPAPAARSVAKKPAAPAQDFPDDDEIPF